MKKLLIILVLLPALSFSQVQDSINSKIVTALQEQARAINRMSTYLDYCDSEYRTGTILTMSGIAAGSAGLLFEGLGNGQGNENSNAPVIVAGIGGLLTLIGTIVIVDSHKWIGRAGRVRLDANKIVIDF